MGKIRLTLVMGILLIMVFPACVWPLPPQITSEAAVLMDMENGQILYQKNIDQMVYPASTTKIMTGLLAIEKGNLTDKVKVSREACLAGGSSVGLQEDEVISFENLLYALLLSSANEAGVALAEHMCGTQEEFVKLMNERAQAIGAVRTNFANPHGLHDPNHYTTAGDLAIIAREAMKNSLFREMVGTFSVKIERVLPRPVDGIPQVDFVNHNRLMWPQGPFEYEGVTGIKTGFTDEAQQCLVASAEKNGREYLTVVMKNESLTGVYTDTINLLDHAFNDFRWVELVKQGDDAGRLAVENGVIGEIRVVSAGKLECNLSAGAGDIVDKKVYIDGNLTAPLFKGQKVGSMYFYLNGKEIGSVELVADRDVEKKFIFHWWYGLAVPAALAAYILAHVRVRRRRYLMRRKRWYIN